MKSFDKIVEKIELGSYDTTEVKHEAWIFKKWVKIKTHVG